MRKFFAVLLSMLPSFMKVPLYRMSGFRIGKGVRIGVSPFINVRECTIGDHVRIGHFNVFIDTQSLEIGDGTHIGFRNIVRGGTRVRIGRAVNILRSNVLNSMPVAEVANARTPELDIGDGSAITTNHWIDFTDRVTLGHNVIVGGRSSSMWTHNRQRVRPIDIGHHCYLGSDVKIAPGARIAPMNVIAIGAVLTGTHAEPLTLIGGNPATCARALRADEYPLVSRRNHERVTLDIAYRDLPAEVIAAADAFEAGITRSSQADVND